MANDDSAFLKDFYRNLRDRPIEPDDPWYVSLYDDPELTPADPVRRLRFNIETSDLETAQLFSGFRGTGKSTELRRLKAELEASGAVVVICDMQDYLNLHTPVDVSDFLLAMAGAFGESLKADPDILGTDQLSEGYFERFWAFMTRTKVDLTGLGASAKLSDVGVDLKANLKADPTFRQVLQKRLQGHLGALVSDVHAFFQDCVEALQARYGQDVRVVLLLDSVENIRGTALNATEVAASLEVLFHLHAEKLRIPNLHVVYTVPPWLKIKTPGLAGRYDGEAQIQCVKVRQRDGSPCHQGLAVLERVIARRGNWRRVLPDQAALDDMILASGGYLRDLFRLLQSLLRLSEQYGLPATQRTIELAKHEVRNNYLPLTHADARWLDRIERTHSAQLDDHDRLHDLARFFDNHLVLTYRNGQDWWSVHPLLVEAVAQQISDLEAEAQRKP